MNRPLLASYRLQFNAHFTLACATGILPYLAALGVTHIYASPLLRARAGSSHGYDIVNHNSLNPEIGSEADLQRFVDQLHERGMGLIVDIVPNHMGVGGDDNAWWLDVLEHGEASPHAQTFDIDWHPVNRVLRNRILLPFLADHYGEILDRGDLRLCFERTDESASFSARYGPHRFPIDPRTWPQILSPVRKLLLGTAGARGIAELTSVIDHCQAIPRRTEVSREKRALRTVASDACKLRLGRLWRRHPPVRDALQQVIEALNGQPGDRGSFNGLHHLLQAQSYRLAYWRVATDEINYRRFFDINDLAGIRMERRPVFEATHRLIGQWIAGDLVDGLRLDHVDGLHDPRGYCRQLQDLARRLRPREDSPTRRFPVWVEKILVRDEVIPADWPVAGTTGYEAGKLINDLFVYPGALGLFDRFYRSLTGEQENFDQVLYRSKKDVIQATLSGEMSVLANLLYRIAQQDRHSRDFTYESLRQALTEIVACLPVYRTYIRPDRIDDSDKSYLSRAVARAKFLNRRTETLAFDYILQLLTGISPPDGQPRERPQSMAFVQRFQQFTAPVMAKGMEDTAFYRYHRLVSLNEIGADPRVFGTSLQHFHSCNEQRSANRPDNLLCTSTHDSKRGEDVRARLNVLTEIPGEWQQKVLLWRRINRNLRGRVDAAAAPSRNDEYLIYQTLLGSWPVQPLDAGAQGAYCQRIKAYLRKAVREAKTSSSWINPAPLYEEAVERFIEGLLGTGGPNPFLDDFVPWQRRVARFGLLNSLGQTLIRLTLPGVPDCYQGTEFWTFDLVDPDNRHPVDFDRRRAALAKLQQRELSEGAAALARDLLEQLEDGRAKLFLIWQSLRLRQARPDLFRRGDYQPLMAQGPRADHLCAYGRKLRDQCCLVVVPRWLARLTGFNGHWPLAGIWGDSRLAAPAQWGHHPYRNVLTNRLIQPRDSAEGALFAVADLLADFPVALLVRE